MRKRTRYSLLVVLALVSALVVAVVLRKTARRRSRGCCRSRMRSSMPTCARCGRRRISSAGQVTRSPEFAKFIAATGIVPERDLDAVAFALHRMDDPNGPNGPVAYSEVFEGRFDGARLDRYLASIATGREEYAGHTIYTVLVEGRTLRIAQLGYDTVAASNMPTAGADPRHAGPLSCGRVPVLGLVAAGGALSRCAAALLGMGDRACGSSLLRARPDHAVRTRPAAAGGYDVCGQPALRRRVASSRGGDCADGDGCDGSRRIR